MLEYNLYILLIEAVCTHGIKQSKVSFMLLQLHYAPRERTSTHLIGWWVVSRPSLYAEARRKILCPCQVLKHSHLFCG
jgi:hypothetical protein